MASRNASVERFKRVMSILPSKVEKQAEAILAQQAAGLAASIKAAVPVDTGALKSTVGSRKVGPLRYQVFAGGPATTRGVGAYRSNKETLKAIGRVLLGGKAGSRYDYDYARAVEFGTVKTPAQPFFFRVYRRDKPSMRRYLASECAKALKVGFDNG